MHFKIDSCKMTLIQVFLFATLIVHTTYGRAFSFWNNTNDHSFPLEDFDLKDISDDVQLYLYTPEEPDTPFDVTITSARQAPFKEDRLTKLIIHGWLEHEDKRWILQMKDDYMKQGDFNVVAVNWFKIAIQGYGRAAKKTKEIGEYVGSVLLAVIRAGLIKTEDIHIAGHSLGAHVAGFAGKSIKGQTGKLMGRITAMDAAGPLFEVPVLVSEDKRLTKNDALFVDAIHTSGGTLGFKSPLGHVDFFPNEGTGIQPGCGLIENVICSHARSHLYYAESINSDNFVSTSCSDWKSFKKGRCKSNEKLPMGFFTPTTARGNFYLYTNKKSPFAKG